MEETRSKGMQLFDYAYFPDYETAIQYLASMAQKEEWSFPNGKQNGILKNYLDHTFRKLATDNQIATSSCNNWSCFNTGLMTNSLECIFALFEQNRIPNTSPFVFKAFLKESDFNLQKHFSSLPEPADYFQNPEALIFNPKLKILPQIDHILEDNEDRFPMHMQGLESDEKRRRLIGAIEEMKKKLRLNYKLAVPQYYRGQIQLLLPLCLTPGSQNPDLALVAYRAGDYYSARTCLTIKMAYSNARLIVQPQSSWLQL